MELLVSPKHGAGSRRHWSLRAGLAFLIVLLSLEMFGGGDHRLMSRLIGPRTAEASGSLAIAPGTLGATATFNSIGVELLFSGDDNANATAALDFRRSGETSWRRALPLWRTDDGSASPGRAFYGSALLLDPGTTYDVRVTVGDPNGVAGSKVLSSTVATRHENIPPASALKPTHFVRAGGQDIADGLSPTTAWRTLDKAITSAPAGAIVQVGRGYYRAATTTRTAPLTLLAQYPAVDDGRAIINAGKHSVIEPAAFAKKGSGTWWRVTLTGPGYGGAPPGAIYTVWKWAGSGVVDATQLGYAATRAAQPARVAHWGAVGRDLETPAGWAEKIYTNRSYNHGFYADGEDIYLRLPGDVDPNGYFVTAGKDRGLSIDGPNVRISGFEIRQFAEGVVFGPNARFGVVDHGLLSGNLRGVSFRGQQGPPAQYGGDHVVQDNLFRDSNLWTDDHANRPAIPWVFVKSPIRNADGTSYSAGRLGRQSESNAIGGSGGAHRVVVRRNTVDGLFNGITPGYQVGFDRYAGRDMDVHDNLIRHIADDALEPENQVINFRAWRNRVEQASVVLSTGPVQYGPIYLFRNEGWRIGREGIAADKQGGLGVGTLYFKYSGTSKPTARIYVVHNSFWTDRPDVHGGAQFAGSGTANEAFYLRNNLIHATTYAFVAPKAAGSWIEDHNYFSTADLKRGLEYGGVRYTTNVAGYRTASRQGARTNLSGTFIDPLGLNGPARGDLGLPAGSPLVDAGVPVPNISDRAGVDYSGSAPDLGARERQ